MSVEVVNSDSEPTIRGVGLLHKAFQILELFSEDRPRWSQVEICHATALPRSTVSRLVRYLCARGYLTQNRGSGRYTLGFSAVQLGRRAQLHFDLTAVAADVLEDLSRKTGETVMLTGFNPAIMQVVCLDQISSQQGGLRVYERVGATFPLYVGASTKPVLAHLPECVIERVVTGPLTPINPAWTQSEARLRADIESIRQRGYAVSFEETYPGVAGVGAAVLGPDGRPLGSIAIAAPLQRMSEESVVRLGEMVAAATRTVSERVGGGAPVPAAEAAQ